MSVAFGPFVANKSSEIGQNRLSRLSTFRNRLCEAGVRTLCQNSRLCGINNTVAVTQGGHKSPVNRPMQQQQQLDSRQVDVDGTQTTSRPDRRGNSVSGN